MYQLCNCWYFFSTVYIIKNIYSMWNNNLRVWKLRLFFSYFYSGKKVKKCNHFKIWRNSFWPDPPLEMENFNPFPFLNIFKKFSPPFSPGFPDLPNIYFTCSNIKEEKELLKKQKLLHLSFEVLNESKKKKNEEVIPFYRPFPICWSDASLKKLSM